MPDCTQKIQIPSTCSIQSAELYKQCEPGKPNQVYWAANGNNSYDITIPYGYFTGYMTPPQPGAKFVLQALNGGNSATLTVDPNAPTGSIIPAPSVSGPGCVQKPTGQDSDIMINP